MAKIDESELGDDFRYILRLAMSDVDGMKPIGLGLTSINGVGKRTATALCEIASVDNKKLGGHLTNKMIAKTTLKQLMHVFKLSHIGKHINTNRSFSLCISKDYF